MGFSFKTVSVAADVTARYTLWSISEDPGNPIVLVVRPAAAPNVAFMNAAFKLASASRASAGAAHLSAARLHAARTEVAELYAQHVIVGWDNVLEDGAPAPCTPEVVLRFLAALIQPPPEGRPDVFDELRAFCGNLDNFRPPTVSGADLGKG
jgi:hypothetical protein